jgi:ABC-type antimicrobial peptide transport system permease subunit
LDLVKSKVEEKAAGLEVKTWLELSPEMSYLSEGMDVLMYLFIIIILFALLFGIVNTMLMVVLERVKEIGMLMAVGMSRLRIFLMILLETVFLSITGGVVGVILGLLISKHFETNAIDLSIVGEGFTEMGYDPFVYTSIDYPLLVNVTILVILTGVIASIYPAIKALKQDPSEALRSE